MGRSVFKPSTNHKIAYMLNEGSKLIYLMRKVFFEHSFKASAVCQGCSGDKRIRTERADYELSTNRWA